ncbi:DUF1566 domain-containing protein [candidate division KSB3 bacterium]|uniref:DUF1566 domain-containing protein n=1 Tax=candidate division KSB3 bacterium TaxID=2044937 RepID=A0A9D5JWC0_9BACT|nr:DUF1566 domain-containing protein [candidate division KSB3 bacterium]MBD3325345.1 DUF1566 domain-containing protein [candidate division KSB3 bacterium]
MVLSVSMVVVLVLGLVGCNALKGDRDESPTAPSGSAFELGNYAQQSGQSRVVTVNGETHQINGVVSGSVVAGGLYIEINEQSSVGSPAGTDQVAVNLQNVTITFTGLLSGVSAIKVSSNGAEIGQYAVSDGSVEIALTYAEWTQWYGPTHYAVFCEAVGDDELVESMAAVSGRLPSGEVVTFGKGLSPKCPPCTSGGGTSCPTSSTFDLNGTPQLIDNGNGTITDARTGLIWLKDANCTDPAGSGVTFNSGKLNWADAKTWAAALNSGECGLTDGSAAGAWRVPTRQELESVLNLTDSTRPIVDTTKFNNVQAPGGLTSGFYWTSTTYEPDTTYAWNVSVDFGYVNAAVKTLGSYYAWAVR